MCPLSVSSLCTESTAAIWAEKPICSVTLESCLYIILPFIEEFCVNLVELEDGDQLLAEEA